MPPVLLLRHIFCCGLILLALPSCEKAEDSTSEPIAPSSKSSTETSAPPPSSAEANPTPPLSAQQKLESKSYYTEENIAAAKALIENLPLATRQSILEDVREGKKIVAVKLIRELTTASLAVSKLAVEMIAISEGVDPGIY